MKVVYFLIFSMKKIVLFILSVIVLYIVSIFVFPSASSYIWERIWLIGFNNWVIKIRDEVNEFFTWFDIMGKYKDTKDSALEIKQNIEVQVQDTKQKIEVIQTKVDETGKAIEQTRDSLNNTVNTLNELWNSISDIVPSSSGQTRSLEE